MQDLVHLFLAGLTASFGPCLFLCSPVLVPFITGTKTSLRQGVTTTLVFSLVRLLAFVLLGVLAAVLGHSLTQLLSRYRVGIAIGTGAVIALLGITIMLGRDLQSNLCRMVHKGTTQGFKGTVLLGLLMGILPCAARIGILAYVAMQGRTVWRGGTMALAFGLGEMWSPVIILFALSGVLPQVLTTPRARLILGRVSGFFVLLIGLRLILGLGT